ncbi:carboxylating nicotinate-nucleotide diphosphorylase [Megalodesulfovibrio gigas]|uniref:nicotinate-nucleotide diphosphorylase (carboxylating) n=1 Tax=Megalodesulfovibrio gigas (strain ATCC 19364 / DSM 1382 / NCIMB 9332 / VKM B-1759) TaxID=1121448 RepID=T2GDM5_MEGG1|nr:carboxylating nicotinate-nucleotide diphosphorylase [Megalodesulfovibrio gigas]AGW14007.1 putative nicotinate-nucleotide pyrophosphorylase [Megalodesulfovibrio gigas DSM 1382 = ATCC 19364]
MVPSLDVVVPDATQQRQIRCMLQTALDEDGPDLTSRGIFSAQESLTATLLAKDDCRVAGLPLIPLVLELAGGGVVAEYLVEEGADVLPGTRLALLRGSAWTILAAERVILNCMCHASGIATLTRTYVAQLQGTNTTLLDTRKTLPGLRALEKYAVRVGGACNHRMDLHSMLMAKDNHIDRAGSITAAVTALRRAYDPCPPMVVECRTVADVQEAVALGVDRCLLDNMDLDTLRAALACIPPTVQSEVSGGVTLDTLAAIASLGPDFVSVGRLTHSAPVADLSLCIAPTDQ